MSISIDPNRPTLETQPKGLLAEYASAEQLLTAARKVRDAGITNWDCHSAFPVHGLDEAMGIKMTNLPWVVFLAGCAGAAAGVGMQWWMNAVDYPFMISGKPYFSLPANIPVAFEFTILLAAISAFLSVLIFNGLPRIYNILFSNPRFLRATTDAFFIAIPFEGNPQSRGQLESLLRGTEGSVTEIREEAGPVRLPWPITTTLMVLGVCALVPPLFVLAGRMTPFTEAPIRFDRGMAWQQKIKTQTASPIFADNTGMRRPVEGTLAVSDARYDDHALLGKLPDGKWADEFPKDVKPSEELIKRGQQRYTIYCSVCHGLAGAGDGPVHRRAFQLQEGTWVQPTAMTADHVRAQTVGEIYNTVTNGIRSMKGYGDRISVEDRWAIVLYVRALQRSQYAWEEDVPTDRRATLPSTK